MNKECLLIGINAKYIHTNLAIRYLKAFCEEKYQNIRYMEFSINDHLDNILREIHRSQSQIFCFSCYIWNIDLVLKLCSSLKKLLPEAVILLGGPEVSFDAEELLATHPYVDYIIRGEGEETLLELLQMLVQEEQSPLSTTGLSCRVAGRPHSNPDRPLLHDLDVIPFPYEDLTQLNNKIIYYETSRGCPFNCQYCLSSTLHGVRYFSMERIKKEIKFFVDSGVRQVKLVDRTFNCNKQHSLAIIRYILELNGKTNFHFEIGADLLDDEVISVLAQAPKDMFQFEIGVQSTNETALREISRAMNLNKLKQNIKALQKAGNSHMHLDLIAGLPYEDFNSFGNSFDEVHALLPEMLQLGFLKLLKGSGVRRRAKEYGIEFNEFTPYEVLNTKWISYDDLIRLKEIEHILELYYNSGRFQNSLSYLFKLHYSSYFQFYTDFAAYWKDKGLFSASQSTKELYNILHGFAAHNGSMDIPLNELIKLDWLMYYNNGNMPDSLNRFDHSKVKSQIQEYLKRSTELHDAFLLKESELKSQLKNIYYEIFYTDVLDNVNSQFEYIVFFFKDHIGAIHTHTKKLAEILKPAE